MEVTTPSSQSKQVEEFAPGFGGLKNTNKPANTKHTVSITLLGCEIKEKQWGLWFF